MFVAQPPLLSASIAFLAALAVLTAATPGSSESGLALMERVGEAMASPGERVSVQMTVRRADGASDTRHFQMWTRSGAGRANQSLIRFEQPASIAGTALLSVQRLKGGQDNWLYVPALGQVRRVAPADRSTAFVQSDFTIEDLSVGVDAEGRDYRVLGEVAYADRTCIQLEDSPRTEAAARASGYQRVVVYVDKELSVVHRVDFYDKAGQLLKVLRAEGLVQVGTLWRFDKASIVNVQTGSSTVMQVVGRAGAEAVTDALFSPSGLGKW